ASELLKYLTT
nr:Chain B, 10-mer from Peroxisome proliferator-activated receptor gamma coactivator 1-alpha [Homo sapiens]